MNYAPELIFIEQSIRKVSQYMRDKKYDQAQGLSIDIQQALYRLINNQAKLKSESNRAQS